MLVCLDKGALGLFDFAIYSSPMSSILRLGGSSPTSNMLLCDCACPIVAECEFGAETAISPVAGGIVVLGLVGVGVVEGEGPLLCCVGSPMGRGLTCEEAIFFYMQET